jgi:transposase
MSESQGALHVWPLGALVLVKPMLDILRFAEIVNQTCPIAEQGDLSHGQVAEVLVCNRFTSPTPFYRVQEWAADCCLDMVLDVALQKLYDNRLGRALDAMHPHLSTLKGRVALQAIKVFDLDLAELHHDATDVTFYGAYEPTPQKGEGLRIVRSRPTGIRPELKRLRLALFTLGDGGIPLWPCVVDGDAHAATFTIPHLEEMRQQLEVKETIVIHDREATSKDNLRVLHRWKLGYVVAVPFDRFLKAAYPSAQAMKDKQIQSVAYVSGRDGRKPPDQRARYYLWQEPVRLVDPEAGETYHALRLYVRNTSKMLHDRAQRRRNVAKVQADMERIQRLLNRYDYTVQNKATVDKRLRRVLRKAGGKYFDVQLQVVNTRSATSAGQDAACLALTWQVKRRQMAQDGRLDGLHILQTNLLERGHSPLDVLTLYKEQYRSEFSARDLKGPMAVTPMFLRKPERLEVLLFLIWVTLLIYVLLARELKRALAGAAFEAWPTITARRIVHAFRSVALVGERLDARCWRMRLTTLNETQQKLLQLLGLPDPVSYVRTGVVPLGP